MLRLMATVVDDTISNVEKKQARTYDELQAELEEAQEVSGVTLFPPLIELPPPSVWRFNGQARDRAFFHLPLPSLQAEMEDDSDEEDDYIYNPLKLPLGWDGKPIPYWLYKLHGLNQEFKCEICGNASYWGRRAFERHFKEWRHVNGMRALGIPNTKSF